MAYLGTAVAEFTPTEQRMLALLADGQPHPRSMLRACLYDDAGAVSNIQPHLSRIRRKLRRRGEGIVCVIWERRICYQHVRLLSRED